MTVEKSLFRMEDDYTWLTVARCEGPMRREDGTVCQIMVGSKRDDGGDDMFLLLSKEAVENLVTSLMLSAQAVIEGHS